MNKEDVKRFEELAIKHNLITEGMLGSFYADALNKFAEELMAQEREACVEVCKRLSKDRGCFVEEVLNEAVEAIRARGEK
jgi:hypothetical protein